MPAKGQGCTKVRFVRGGNPPYPSSAPASPAPGRRCCLRRPATTSRCMSAAMPRGCSPPATRPAACWRRRWCEAEMSEPLISRLGLRALDLWRRELPDTPFNGSLVVAHSRDRNDFERFARLTTGHRRLDAKALAGLEPSLEGRFRDALFFAGGGHVEPRPG